MPLSTASILSAPTLSATGGTPVPLTSLGIDDGTNVVVASGDTDLRSQRSIVCSAKMPKVSTSAPNGYTQARATFVIKHPLALDNGSSTVNTARVEFAFDPETIESERDELRAWAAQVCFDTDFVDLVNNMSLA